MTEKKEAPQTSGALEALREKIDWWKTDMAYKAPEQLTPMYFARMIDELEAALAADEQATAGRSLCTGHEHDNCNYLAFCGAVCTKCGQLVECQTWMTRTATQPTTPADEQATAAAVGDLDECACSHVKAQHHDDVCTANNPREQESPDWGLCYCNEFDMERDDSWRWQYFATTEPATQPTQVAERCYCGVLATSPIHDEQNDLFTHTVIDPNFNAGSFPAAGEPVCDVECPTHKDSKCVFDYPHDEIHECMYTDTRGHGFRLQPATQASEEVKFPENEGT